MASEAFQRVLDALQARNLQPRLVKANQVRARCPTHDDRKPSLVATWQADRGRVLMKCWAGCRTTSVLEALGLHLRDLFSGPRIPQGRSRLVETYDYITRHGEFVAQKVRFNPKGFAWRTPDATERSGFRKGLNGVRPGLYRLPDLADAALVFVVEGEKSADRLAGLRLVATCGHVGANSNTPKLAADLLEASGAAVIAILPDHDRAGAQYGEHVAKDLAEARGDRGAGPIGLKVVSLPGLPVHGDVSDWLDAGGTRDALLDLVAAAPAWSPDTKARRRTEIRAEQQRERRRQRRAEQSTPAIAARVSPQDASQAALRAVLEALGLDDGPRSGLQLKEALNGRHTRDVVDAALRLGVETGALAIERAPRNTNLYRPGHSDIHRLQLSGHSNASPETRFSNFAKETPVSECPEAVKPEARGERTSCTLQETTSTATERSPASASGDWEEASGRPETGDGLHNTRRPARERPPTRRGAATAGRDTRNARASAAVTCVADNGPRETTHAERLADIDCCGRNGAEPRCQLCQWSPTYLHVLAEARRTRLEGRRPGLDERPVEERMRLAGLISLPGGTS